MTIHGIPYDAILRAVDHDQVTPDDLPRLFPGLTAEAWYVAAYHVIEQHIAALDKETQ